MLGFLRSLGGGGIRKPRGSTSEGGLGRPEVCWGSSAPWVGVASVNHGVQPLRVGWLHQKLAGIPPLPRWGVLSVNHWVRPLRVGLGRPKFGWGALTAWFGGAVRKPRGRGLTSENGLGRSKLCWSSSTPWFGGGVLKPRGLTSEGGLGRPKVCWGSTTP